MGDAAISDGGSVMRRKRKRQVSWAAAELLEEVLQLLYTSFVLVSGSASDVRAKIRSKVRCNLLAVLQMLRRQKKFGTIFHLQ